MTTVCRLAETPGVIGSWEPNFVAQPASFEAFSMESSTSALRAVHRTPV